MLIGSTASSGMYLYIPILVIVVCILLFEIFVWKNSMKKMAEMERKIAAFEQLQSDISASYEEEVALLKEMLQQKIGPLKSKLSEMSKKASMIYERNEVVRRELERKVRPLKASIDDTAAKFSSSQDALRKTVQEGKNEIEMMAKDIDVFAREIQKMKDFIRERIVDLEV
jgi:hypothetical protein